MDNFKLGRYLLLITCTQFLTLLILGNIREGGDLNAASAYLVVFFLPAVLFHFLHGFLLVLVNPTKRLGQFWLVLLLPILLCVGVNEALQPAAQAVYRCIILATLGVNGLYFFSLLRKQKAARSTDQS